MRSNPLAAALWMVLASLSSTPCTVHSGVVVLAPSKDASMFEDAEGTLADGTGEALFCGRNRQMLRRRALIAFEVAGAIPEGAVVDSAVLILHVSNAPDQIPRPFSLHRLEGSWGEGASDGGGGGSGAPASSGDATWLHRSFPGAHWISPGGDFAAEASATTVVGDLGAYRWSGVSLTDDVRAWRSEPWNAHGWMLVGDETTRQTTRRFDSRSAIDPARRPALVIHYSSGGNGAGGAVDERRTSTWGHLKTRFR